MIIRCHKPLTFAIHFRRRRLGCVGCQRNNEKKAQVLSHLGLLQNTKGTKTQHTQAGLGECGQTLSFVGMRFRHGKPVQAGLPGDSDNLHGQHYLNGNDWQNKRSHLLAAGTNSASRQCRRLLLSEYYPRKPDITSTMRSLTSNLLPRACWT